ncbi:DUF3368 domain-containing protein [Dyadobacter sp. CY343]|uniref:DUF3368 domain-containing protein n=1 Tax=Dyadobacter sp. CY343 TaxID=2907299 RepID=UPI001F46B3CC|nr:DUF3368 domain-containing protein [Dyadobacter sp. CY343]MCE7061140.1 DUF3368 domain-containing protein [Dyadobacter sp. CY343]
MIVVSDTSVISGLLQSDSLFILHKLYNKVVIPNEVFAELSQLDKKYIDQVFSDWIEIRHISETSLVAELALSLDAGEAEAIILAKELNADLLLIDEKKGRAIASQMGLKITGILGTLIEAKRQNHVKAIKPIIKVLINEVGVWFNADLILNVLTQVNEN